MYQRRACPLLLAAALAALGAPRPARAYSEPLHAFLTGRALEGAHPEWREEQLTPPSAQDLSELRLQLYRAAATVPDAALRAKFLARYPTEASFDAWELKQLFMLDPSATVHGFDLTADDAAPQPRLSLLERAARWPDDDHRNRNRFQRDAARAVVKGADGDPLPYDPATLDLGGLQGGSSQGHAHYGLLHDGRYSDDPEVLKKDPRHFAIPPGIHAWGQDFAQLYADLALFAAGSGLPSSRWLEVTFEGAAFHHLEDVANQIHTVQVGIYDFFAAAFLQAKLRDVKTLGGLLGERATLQSLGLRLISNHHLFLEDLFARRVLAAGGANGPPEVVEALRAVDQQGDTAEGKVLTAAAQAAGPSGEWARALADALVEISSHEGPEAYRLAWHLSAKTLHDGRGHAYASPGDEPDAFLVPDSPARAQTLSRFYELEGKGLVRAAVVLRAFTAQHALAARAGQEQRALGQEQRTLGQEQRTLGQEQRTLLVQRMLRVLLPYHEAAAARRAAYVPKTPAALGIAWGYPAAALVLLVAVGLLVRRSLRGRAGQAAAQPK